MLGQRVSQERQPPGVMEEVPVCYGCSFSPRKGLAQLQGGGLEVNLSRGEQGEGQEWVGTGIHTQPLPVCCC